MRAQLSAFGTERVTTSGEPVMLRAEAVQNVALALHELATNASKYGALSVPTAGSRSNGRAAMAMSGIRLTWRESGGPPVTEPERKGFGRFVLERVTVNALGAGGTRILPTGLVWTCDINAEHLVRPPGRAAPKQGPDTKRRLAS